jgi:hypothetical protein
MPKHNPTKLCAQCGKPYDVRLLSLTRFKKRRFCSAQCTGANQCVAPELRFWQKVDKFGPVPLHRPELGPCWIWTRGTRKYCSFRFKDKLVLPHRFSWKLHFGEPSPKLMVCHHCDNPRCVRPDHLFLGTQLENMRDAAAKKRLKAPTGNATLTEDQVREIRRADANGIKSKVLARVYGVTYTAIRFIVRRDTWAHVE